MDVVLLERIDRLGQMGDVVKVKAGYARNFLLPQGKALRASPDNIARFEAQRAQLEAQNLERRKEAEAVAEKLDGESFVVIRQASESGQLYGSVATRDIADLITAGGFTLTRNQVILDRPIKTLGLHDVRVRLHPEVTVKVVMNVARTEDEAERLARGEDVTLSAAEREELEILEAAEAVFEDEALAEQAVEELSGEEGAGEAAEAEAEGEEPKTE